MFLSLNGLSQRHGSSGKTEEHKNHHLRKILAFVLAIFIIGGSVGAVFILSEKTSASTLIPQAIQVVAATVTVGNGSYLDYPLFIPSGASNAYVSGTFAVQGSSSGFEIYVLDNTNFNEYKIGGTYGGLYQSGQASTGTIGSSLFFNDTTYYLVLDNTLSTIPTTVNIQANLTYSMP